PCVRERTPECRPDEQCAHEPGTLGKRDAVDTIHARSREAFTDHGRQTAHVVPRCELRYDPTVAPMEVDLAVEPVRDQAPCGVVNGHPRLVATRLDAQYMHGRGLYGLGRWFRIRPFLQRWCLNAERTRQGK